MTDEMAASPHRRARLSTDTIVAAAAALVDSGGDDLLTMRRLATELRVQAMSIYRYFTSRRALLDAVVELVTDRLTLDLSARLLPDDDWREYLSKLAHQVRQMASTHPRLFLLISSHPTVVPWLQPPIRSLRWADAFVVRLQSDHFSPAATVAAYKQFSRFLLGHLLHEAAARRDAQASARDRGEPSAGPPDRPSGVELGAYPHVAALAGQLSADTHTADFEHGLAEVLDQLGCTRRDPTCA